MVFEDMQWADAGLVGFVEHLLEWSRNRPILVVTLARPEFLESHPTWGAGQRNFTSLHLEPLPDGPSRAARAARPRIAANAARRIAARAEGVPLYAVETLRMLLAQGVMASERRGLPPHGDLSDVAVPDSLRGLVAARLDLLPAAERSLVQDAAVLGQSFTSESLAAITDGDAESLDDLLSGLVRRELLRVEADPRSPEHGQYVWVQAVLREVAYATLSKRDRHTRHMDAAAHLIAALGEGRGGGGRGLAPRGRLPHRARRKGDGGRAEGGRTGCGRPRQPERAQSLAASAEAQRYFEQAAELTDDAGRRNELVDRAEQVAWRAGRAVEARALLERAHTAYMADGQVRPAARVSARLGEIDWNEGHPQAAVDRISAALEAMGGEPDEDFAVVVGQLGRFLVLTDQIERGAVHVEQALDSQSGSTCRRRS